MRMASSHYHVQAAWTDWRLAEKSIPHVTETAKLLSARPRSLVRPPDIPRLLFSLPMLPPSAAGYENVSDLAQWTQNVSENVSDLAQRPRNVSENVSDLAQQTQNVSENVSERVPTCPLKCATLRLSPATWAYQISQATEDMR